MLPKGLFAGTVLLVSGCLDESPALEARSQQIVFDPPPAPSVDEHSAIVVAHASSGLPVSYSSLTPDRCSVDQTSGVVTAAVAGACIAEANQLGDARFAPARPVTQSLSFQFRESISFREVPVLGLYDAVMVEAIASSGTAIVYTTSTPLVCAVNGQTGMVVALATGTCIVVATADALQADLSITVQGPQRLAVPGAPTSVTATLAGNANSAWVMARSVASGSSPITGYSVASTPPGIWARGTSLPVTVSCPTDCAGYSFTLAAENALGESPRSAVAELLSDFTVTAVFHEPDTQPNDTFFIGQYRLNSTTGVVTGLNGRLSESMTGSASPYPNDTMSWLFLGHQLVAQPFEADGARGLLVTTFLLATTNTLTDNSAYGGTDGWAPGTGFGLYAGYPGANVGNAYVTVFVNPQDPFAPITPRQLAKLAYADCTPGGMMGATCMTGTSLAGYGILGTMGGAPISQVTIQRQSSRFQKEDSS